MSLDFIISWSGRLKTYVKAHILTNVISLTIRWIILRLTIKCIIIKTKSFNSSLYNIRSCDHSNFHFFTIISYLKNLSCPQVSIYLRYRNNDMSPKTLGDGGRGLGWQHPVNGFLNPYLVKQKLIVFLIFFIKQMVYWIFAKKQTAHFHVHFVWHEVVWSDIKWYRLATPLIQISNLTMKALIFGKFVDWGTFYFHQNHYHYWYRILVV